MSTLTDLFPTHDVLDYTNAIQTPSYLGAQLFPSRKVLSNEIKILMNGTVIPTIAHVHALDTEAEIGERNAEIASIEPFFVKKKLVLKEQDMMNLRYPRTPAEQGYLIKNVYDDVASLRSSLDATAELMRMQVLMNGLLNLKDQDGNSYKVDYQLDKAQKGTANFADKDTDPLETIQGWVDSMVINPTRAVMSQKALSALMRNPHIVADIFGSNNGRTVVQSDLDSLMTANNLPVLRAYKGKYKDTIKGKPVVSSFIDDGSFAMFADGIVGETVYGLTPEESRSVAAGEVEQSAVGNIMINEYEENHDPIESVIKASTMIVPTLAQRESLFQATVL